MYKRTLLLGLCSISLLLGLASEKLSIIPLPKSVETKQGEFLLTSSTSIVVSDNKCMRMVELFRDFVHYHHDCSISINSLSKKTVHFVLDESCPFEAYELIVEEDKILLTGNIAGLFYASQSLLQLIDRNTKNELYIPCVAIKDEPRFGYRGLMLDVGRYFYSVEYIKKFLDLMAYYKFNVFHWHLTEDSGWRIEIKKYPELTKKGAWRSSTLQHDRQNRVPHGGFYTQEEVKDIIKFASERHITVIPEIEMPGHAMAALSVFPELSCTGGPFAIPLCWGIKEEIFCAGNDKTFEFLENVLSEIIDLFPSKYIHIGGDEALKKRWKECPKCQDRIRKENLKDEYELQSYFIRRIEKFINSKGKQIIGWDEILEGGVAPNATVMSWRGEEGGMTATSQGHDAIMVPHTFMYLDYYQSRDRENEPMGAHWYPNPVKLSDVYHYEPYASIIDEEHQKHVIGVQANIWMEMIHSQEHVEYMTYPRALALSEIAWTQHRTKAYDDFVQRLSVRLAELDDLGVLYRIPEPYGWDQVQIKDGYAIIQLTPPVKDSKIFYTIDGSDPTAFGQLYMETIKLPLLYSGLNVKCIVQLSSGRTSGVYTLKERD